MVHDRQKYPDFAAQEEYGSRVRVASENLLVFHGSRGLEGLEWVN
jgi:hypothetical protein